MGRGTRPFSARLDAAVIERLQRRGRRTGLNRSRLAERYIDEGMRMDDHPGIVFRDGPTGRRAGLAGGPDVWEVINLQQGGDDAGEAAIVSTAEWLDLTPAQVRTAVGYHAAYPEEVDERIRDLHEDADAAEAVWRRAHPARS